VRDSGECYTSSTDMFDKKRRRAHGHHERSIDGIISDSPRLGMPVTPPRGASQSGKLGLLTPRGEGFHPMRTGGAEVGAAAETLSADALDEPILLDNIEPDKSRKKTTGRRRSWRRLFKRAGLVLAALVLLGGAYFGIKFYITQKNLFRGGGNAPALAEEIDINKLRSEGDGRVNILLLGIGGEGHVAPDLTDTIMIISLDPINKKVALLSIPRDLWVKIPGNGSQKINAAYAYGKNNSKSKDESTKKKEGINLVDETLQAVLGIPIHYHAVVDFKAFKQAVDALGGITVNVPETLYDPTIAWENNYNSTIAKAGPQTFNGAKALLYVKSRLTSSDFARAERQRLVLVAMKDKIFSVGTYANPVRMSQLLSSFGDNVYTDFSLNDVMRLYSITSKIPSSDITSLDLVTPPHDFLTTGNVGGFSVVRPKTALFDYAAIQSYVRNTLRDGFLAKENSAVAVYNATTVAGLGKTKGDLLKSYGYNVTVVDNAPNQTNPLNTVLVDLSNGVDKYTRHYLELRFKVTARTAIPAEFGINPPVGTKFVIIVGKDAGQ